jgi:Trypsin-co-occurring domain 2
VHLRHRRESSKIDPIGTVSFDDVIRNVKSAIQIADLSANESPALEVRQVVIDLTVVQELKAGAEAKLTVPVIGTELSASGSIDSSSTSEISLTLVPPPPADALAQGEMLNVDVIRDLVGAIEAIKNGVIAAAKGDPPFDLKESTAKLTFGVKTDGSIAILVTADRSKSTMNSLTLTIGPKT